MAYLANPTNPTMPVPATPADTALASIEEFINTIESDAMCNDNTTLESLIQDLIDLNVLGVSSKNDQAELLRKILRELQEAN